MGGLDGAKSRFLFLTSCFSTSNDVIKQEVRFIGSIDMRDMTQMSLWLDPDDAETIIWSDFDDVQIALGRLGVPLNVLMQALQEGETSRNDRTPHDAPTAPGFIRWNTALRSLSDSLVPQGWSRNDKSNWPNLVHPKSLIALAIASGNKNVGNPDFAPSTKSDKGKMTKDAVACNATQLTLLPEYDLSTGQKA
jgi:hypothetical protein